MGPLCPRGSVTAPLVAKEHPREWVRPKTPAKNTPDPPPGGRVSLTGRMVRLREVLLQATPDERGIIAIELSADTVRALAKDLRDD